MPYFAVEIIGKIFFCQFHCHPVRELRIFKCQDDESLTESKSNRMNRH